MIIIRRYHVSITPGLAPAAPALASSRPCSVDFSQLGSGCSNRRFRSPRDRRAARHPAGRYRNSGPAPRGSLLRPLFPAGPYCCYSCGCFPGQSRENFRMDGLRAVPPLGGPQAVDCGRFGNPYIPKASLPRLGLAGGDHSPCRGRNAPHCLDFSRSGFAPAIARCGLPVPRATTAKKNHFLPVALLRPRSPRAVVPGWRTCALAPALPFLTVLQPLSPLLRAASPSASLPRGPSPCALRRPSSRRGPAAPLARGRRCRARPGPARFGSSAVRRGLPPAVAWLGCTIGT